MKCSYPEYLKTSQSQENNPILKKWAKDVNRNFTKEGKRQLSI